jgi:hypothetical protein
VEGRPLAVAHPAQPRPRTPAAPLTISLRNEFGDGDRFLKIQRNRSPSPNSSNLSYPNKLYG